MHAARSRTFEEALGFSSLTGGLYLTPHSNAFGSWSDCIRGRAWFWKKAILEGSPCVQMLGFRPCWKREMKEAGLQSYSQHILWVQHIDKPVLLI
jgi:hypothetical protein